MPGPTPMPVANDADLPAAVDVVVIGGGIIGASTALELTERGLSVALCEKGGIGHEQSSRNWGWVRIALRDPREVPLMVEAIRLWAEMDRRTGAEIGYRRCGIVFAAQDADQRDRLESWMRHLEPFQISARMLDRDGMEAMGMAAVPGTVGGLHTPMDARAEPQKAAPAIAKAARARGATVHTGCAVRGIETAAGRVSGVVTERGPIRCDAVVLAGGAWSNLFCGNLGIDLPQLGVINHVLRTAPVPGGPDVSLWSREVSIRRRGDGGYTIARGSGNTVPIVPNSFRYGLRFFRALRMQRRELHLRFGRQFFHEAARPRRWALDAETPFERERVLDPPPAPGMLRGLMAAAGRALPPLAGARVEQTWAGCIDVTPDAIPVISGVDALPGFFIATGFSGHGFGIGPGAGRLMADLVSGATPCVPADNFRLSRFSDGSRVAPDDGM